MKQMKKITAWLLVMLLVAAVLPVHSYAAEEDTDLKTMITETSKGMKGLIPSDKEQVMSDREVFLAGDSLCDWVAVAWAISGEEEAYADYLSRLETYVSDVYQVKGRLHDIKATETQRVALTVLALGGDPLKFGTDADGKAINLVKDGTYGFELGESAAASSTTAEGKDGKTKLALGKQGINGYIYALFVLDAMNYEVPAGEEVTREVILDAILDAQLENGAFALDEGAEADVDITAMVLQALAPYQDQDAVKEAIDRAINWLSEQMSDYATFACVGVESSESSSQVLLAMSALGIDINTEERLIKNGMTVLDGLNLFRLDDGTYMHSMSEGAGNLMATEQALLALNAAKKASDGDGRLYDFTTYEGPVKSQTNSASDGWKMPAVIAVGVVLVCIIIVGGVVRKKKK